MTEQEIINSQAFKAINLLIEQKANELRSYLKAGRDRIEYAHTGAQYKTELRMFTYEEGHGKNQELDCWLHDAQAGAEMILHAATLEKEIGDLLRFKLRLLNDYDFTHGDDAEQKAVFGAPDTEAV